MSKSSWKLNSFTSNLFIDRINNKKSIKSRFAIISESDIGESFYVYNGKSYFLVNIFADMVGKKFGEFSLTRKYPKVPEKWLKLKKK